MTVFLKHNSIHFSEIESNSKATSSSEICCDSVNYMLTVQIMTKMGPACNTFKSLTLTEMFCLVLLKPK